MSNKNQLTQNELNYINKKKKKYESIQAVCIEVLKMVQKNRGWISDQLIIAIAKVLCISPSNLEEIATFYSQIYRKPVGKNIIKYCDSVVCYIMGYQKIQNTLELLLNIKPGQTTIDKKFTLLPISCLGKCDKAPVMLINENMHCNLTNDYIPILLEKYK